MNIRRALSDLMTGPTDDEIVDEYEEDENSKHPDRHTHRIAYIGDLEVCRRCGMVRHMEHAELMDPDNRAWFRVEDGSIIDYEGWDECPNPEGHP